MAKKRHDREERARIEAMMEKRRKRKDLLAMIGFIYSFAGLCLGVHFIRSFVSGCKTPVVICSSGSMEPMLYRGDVLLLAGSCNWRPLKVGDIVVFELPGRPEGHPGIIHRVIEVHSGGRDGTKLLTKGDNNGVDDRGVYGTGLDGIKSYLREPWLDGAPMYIRERDVIGRLVSRIPLLGYISIYIGTIPPTYTLAFVTAMFWVNEFFFGEKSQTS